MNPPIDLSNVTLQTPRLTLRPWEESDLQDLYDYASVEGVGEMAGWPTHTSLRTSQAVLAMFRREKKTFALEYRGKVVGSLGVDPYHRAHYPQLEPFRGREIGYALAKDCWGQGLMTEAVRTVIDYLFEREKLDFLVVCHFVDNHRSQRVIEKCGFQYLKDGVFEIDAERWVPTREYILWNPNRKS